MNRFFMSFIFISFFTSLSIAQEEEKKHLIILYGTSSSGKTSISRELKKHLPSPNKWKVLGIDDFPAPTPEEMNKRVWTQANNEMKAGFHVIVDTVITRFYFDQKIAQPFVVVTYCSPCSLIEHVAKRNQGSVQKDHRSLKLVLAMFCEQYKKTTNKQCKTACLKKSELDFAPQKKSALKKLKKHFFEHANTHELYLEPRQLSYDCIINTGILSITQSAQKIKQEFLLYA